MTIRILLGIRKKNKQNLEKQSQYGLCLNHQSHIKMTLMCTSFLAMLSLEGKHIRLEQCKVMVCSVLLHSQLRNQGSREQHISCSLDTCFEIVSCAILLLFPYVSTNFNAENLVFSWNFRAYVSCKCEKMQFLCINCIFTY